MDVAEVIHREAEWELAAIVQGNQHLAALRCLVIVTLSR